MVTIPYQDSLLRGFGVAVHGAYYYLQTTSDGPKFPNKALPMAAIRMVSVFGKEGGIVLCLCSMACVGGSNAGGLRCF